MYTHSKVAIGAAALGQSLANVVYEILLAASGGADSLFLELDLRHDVRSRGAQLAQWAGGVVRVRSRGRSGWSWGSVAGRSEDALSGARSASGSINIERPAPSAKHVLRATK